jgi:hypothetical protein
MVTSHINRVLCSLSWKSYAGVSVELCWYISRTLCWYLRKMRSSSTVSAECYFKKSGMLVLQQNVMVHHRSIMPIYQQNFFLLLSQNSDCSYNSKCYAGISEECVMLIYQRSIMLIYQRSIMLVCQRSIMLVYQQYHACISTGNNVVIYWKQAILILKLQKPKMQNSKCDSNVTINNNYI